MSLQAITFRHTINFRLKMTPSLYRSVGDVKECASALAVLSKLTKHIAYFAILKDYLGISSCSGNTFLAVVALMK